MARAAVAAALTTIGVVTIGVWAFVVYPTAFGFGSSTLDAPGPFWTLPFIGSLYWMLGLMGAFLGFGQRTLRYSLPMAIINTGVVLTTPPHSYPLGMSEDVVGIGACLLALTIVVPLLATWTNRAVRAARGESDASLEIPRESDREYASYTTVDVRPGDYLAVRSDTPEESPAPPPEKGIADYVEMGP